MIIGPGGRDCHPKPVVRRRGPHTPGAWNALKLKPLAGGPGFEPRMPGSEPGVLPLNYPPTGRITLAPPRAGRNVLKIRSAPNQTTFVAYRDGRLGGQLDLHEIMRTALARRSRRRATPARSTPDAVPPHADFPPNRTARRARLPAGHRIRRPYLVRTGSPTRPLSGRRKGQ